MLNWIVWNKTVYFEKMNMALNNLQRLIFHETQTNQILFVEMIIKIIFFMPSYLIRIIFKLVYLTHV